MFLAGRASIVWFTGSTEFWVLSIFASDKTLATEKLLSFLKCVMGACTVHLCIQLQELILLIL